MFTKCLFFYFRHFYIYLLEFCMDQLFLLPYLLNQLLISVFILWVTIQYCRYLFIMFKLSPLWSLEASPGWLLWSFSRPPILFYAFFTFSCCHAMFQTHLVFSVLQLWHQPLLQ